MQAVLPHMVALKAGSIINISIIAGQRYIGKPQVGYAAAKAGLMQLTKTAVIHAKDNVRVNCVVEVDAYANAEPGRKICLGDLDGFISNAMPWCQCAGWAVRMMSPIRFVSGVMVDYITATDIVVDGGITAATQGDLP